jgi:multidrug efflux system membrane fusion protein
MEQYLPKEQRPVVGTWHRLNRRTRWILVAIAILAAVLLVWHLLAGWLSARHKKPAPPPPVKVTALRRQSVNVSVQTIGQVVSVATVNVTAQVSGKLLTAYFTEGQVVRKGDPLFLIDPAPFRAQLEQAQAQLAKDEAQAASLNNDEIRYTTLYAQNAASQQQRDQAVAAAKGGRAVVEADHAAIDLAQQNLGYTLIRSPVDGKTGAIQIQPGNLVGANGTTPLVVITQIRPIKVSFALPQDRLGQIQAQMAAGQLNVSVQLPGTTEKAPADFVGNLVNPATGTIELRATFPNDDQRLVPGQSVHLSAAIATLDNALVAPRDAVNLGPDGSYVFVVGKDNKAYRKTVKVLNDDGTQDAISGDLKPGDRVVTDGQLRVTAGQPVQVARGRAPAQQKAAQ